MANDTTNMPCPLCGGASFTWGWLHGYGNMIPVFKPQKVGFLAFLGGGDKVHSRLCNECGNILFFSDLFIDENASRQLD